MSAPLMKLYRVIVLESSTYAVPIEAANKSSAEEKARALWDRGETDQFSAKEVSLDYIEAELL